jgi:hypothetical protein
MKTLPSEAIVISIPSLMPDASKLSSKSGSIAELGFGAAFTKATQRHDNNAYNMWFAARMFILKEINQRIRESRSQPA